MTGDSELTIVGVDNIVGDSELALCHSRQVAGVGGDNTSDGCIIRVSWVSRFRR